MFSFTDRARPDNDIDFGNVLCCKLVLLYENLGSVLYMIDNLKVKDKQPSLVLAVSTKVK